jgi:hemerythrin
MQSFSYPSFESHRKVHENLLNVIISFGRKIDQGTLEKAKLASFLKNWLFTHIMGVDTKYADTYLNHSTKNNQKVAC